MQNLLLLHGAIGAKDQLNMLAGRLSNTYTVHTLNFSGHGGAPFGKEGFSIPLFAEEVLAYLRENNINQVNIFGYSMGGYVAMYLARHHPTIIGKVITLATKFHWDDAIAAKEVKMLDAEIIEQKVPAFASQLKERHHPNDWKTVLAKTRNMLAQLGKRNSLSLEDYTSIPSSCLLLLGDKDKMISMEETIAVQKALPDASFQLLPDTPHPIEQVDTKLLVSLITSFIGR